MEEMSDLISREALKKATKELYNETLDAIVKFGIEKVYELINNAPAVNTYTIEDIQEVQHNFLILGAKLAQRTQGEWIKQHGKIYMLVTDEGNFVGEFTKCPKCLYDKARGSKFCPNCGADMRKGGAENEKTGM